MSPKFKTALAVAVPLLLVLAKLLAPTTWPAYVSTTLVVLLAAVAVANVFHVPASVVDVLNSLVAALQGAGEYSAHVALVARARKMAGSVVAASVLLLGMGVAIAPSTTACNATPAQIATTIGDGIKVGACIIGQVLAGITDPTQLLVCEGATADLIVAAIDDFTTPRPNEAGALMSGAQSRGVTPQGLAYLAEARAKAIAKKDGGS